MVSTREWMIEVWTTGKQPEENIRVALSVEYVEDATS
jgi:hypothetical protein